MILNNIITFPNIFFQAIFINNSSGGLLNSKNYLNVVFIKCLTQEKICDQNIKQSFIPKALIFMKLYIKL